MVQELDVVIVGGSISGLLLARHLLRARPGVRVAVIDRGPLPGPADALKVGESTSEVAAWYLTERLGLEPLLRREHVLKLGLRFFGARGAGLTERAEFGLLTPRPGDYTVPFEGLSPPTFQLHRGRLEHALAARLVEDGALLLGGCEVASTEEGRPHRVWLTDGRCLRARWLVRATGGRPRHDAVDLEHRAAASFAWFRGEIDVDTLEDEAAFRDRSPPDMRWRSTNHLLGVGAWVWLIRLPGGLTSLGVVHDPAQHPTPSDPEALQAWLEAHEPALSRVTRELEVVQFGTALIDAHHHRPTIRADRTAVVGRAAVSLDPLYSPGLDMAAFTHELLVDLICRELEGEPIESAVRRAEVLLGELVSHYAAAYRGLYDLVGHPAVMTAKIAWDLAVYFGFVALLARSGRVAEPDFLLRIRHQASRVSRLQHRVQDLLRAWAVREPAEALAGVVDQSVNGLLHELVSSLRAPLDRAAFVHRLERNLRLMEELATAIFLRASSGMQVPPGPINPYAISLQPMRWPEDGLTTGRHRVVLGPERRADLAPLWLGQALPGTSPDPVGPPDTPAAWPWEPPGTTPSQQDPSDTPLEQASQKIGRGPAREACLRAMGAFLVGKTSGGVSSLPVELRLFAWEGVGLGLALRGLPDPAVEQPALAFLAIGRGWAHRLQRLPISELPEGPAADGAGFCAGLVEGRRAWLRRAALSGERQAWFDHGLGRSLWFSSAGRWPDMVGALAGLEPERLGDVWRGLGLAVAFTGGVEAAEVRRLLRRAGAQGADLTRGVRAGAALHRGAGCEPESVRQAELGVGLREP